MTKVSVVIPTYNTGELLRPTLESALALLGADVEVIVVDDGSSDDTAHIARSYDVVKVIAQPNKGDSAARQKGLEESTGEFIIFLDHDDILHPRAAEYHLQEIEADRSLDMVFGSNLTIDIHGTKVGENRQPRRLFSAADVVMHTTPSFSQCMYRRSALEAIGGFRAEAKSCADTDLNIRLLGWRQAGLCHGKTVMSYRLHSGQQTRRPSRQFDQLMEVLTDLLGPGGTFENAQLLRKSSRYWKSYFGQFIPAEVVHAIRAKDTSRAKRALATFVRGLPYSAAGAAGFAINRIGRA